MTFKYDTSNFQTAFIAILIVVCVLALVQGLGRTYIAYLNRESLSSFFFYFVKFWALWMFYFLFCISGYWFLFSKTTQNLFIFIPASSDAFYPAFYTLAGLMGFFRLVTIIIDKKDKLNTEVFMINWEKGQFKNSWREIFIINSLAEFYTHRTVSVFWMLLIVMFFLVGFNWEDHAAEVTHTDLGSIFYFNPVNRVFLYFLGNAIFIVVGIVFKSTMFCYFSPQEIKCDKMAVPLWRFRRLLQRDQHLILFHEKKVSPSSLHPRLYSWPHRSHIQRNKWGYPERLE